jgi:hypothetical protein
MTRALVFPLPKGEGQGEGEESVICSSEGEWFKYASFPLIPAFSLGEKEASSPAWIEFGGATDSPSLSSVSICVHLWLKKNSLA